MEFIKVLPLVASCLTTVAPATQIYHIARSRSAAGISPATGVVLVVGTALSLLLGVQYQLGTTLFLMTVALLLQSTMLFMVSRRAFGMLVLASAALACGLVVLAPTFAWELTTSRYTEHVAFLWGLIAAGTFIPQVRLTHRTRMTGDLSLVTILCFAVGMTLWTLFGVLVRNWSLTLWNSIITVSVYELLRLKLTINSEPSPRYL